ncbi:MAG: hypothetical protein L6Q57_08595 [Alphaproteobacteria bacterium]|nr:hypothetical protein [Alphaproteobacteria bacterium]
MSAQKKGAARLMAVQAVYEGLIYPRPAQQIVQDYLDRAGKRAEPDHEPFLQPDAPHLIAIVSGVAAHGSDLDAMIKAHVKVETELEPLLKAVLLCGAYELLAHPEIDAPIIINDYLDVAHGFYSPSEVAMVNAVLDALRKKLRP